jgi:hypothetical protein
VGIFAQVTDVNLGTNTITVSVANIGVVSGVIRFAHLPAETSIDASVGIKMKWSIKTSKANSTVITSLYAYTTSTATSRASQYVLTPVTVKVTVESAADFSVISGARVYLEAAAGGPLSAGTVIMNQTTDANGVAQNTAYAYTADQPVTGRVRKGTSAPFYKTAPLTGTITSSGLTLTSFMVSDI